MDQHAAGTDARTTEGRASGARRLGLGLVAGGAAAQVSGLGLDAWLHAKDGRAADGLLALEDVGHAVFVAGLVAVAVGALLALLGPRLYRPGEGTGLRLAQFGAPVVVTLLVAGGLVGAGSSTLGGPGGVGDAGGAGGDHHGHDHVAPARCDLDVNTASFYREAVARGIPLEGSGADHHHADDAALDDGGARPVLAPGESAAGPATAAAPAGGHGEHKGPQSWRPLTDPATCEQLRTELDAARATAERYPTAADAQAAGYVMVTTYLPEIASHWMRFAHVDDRFVIEEPEMLLYDGNGLDARIVGLSYYIVGEPDQPPTVGFTGGNTEYHRHVGLCVRGTLVVGNEATTAEECRARGGIKTDGSRAWMAHAWVVPGCESPWGVFSAANPKLTPELGLRSGEGAPCSGSGTDHDDTPGVPPELTRLLDHPR